MAAAAASADLHAEASANGNAVRTRIEQMDIFDAIVDDIEFDRSRRL